MLKLQTKLKQKHYHIKFIQDKYNRDFVNYKNNSGEIQKVFTFPIPHVDNKGE